ncbi:sugar phosphate exchanger 2 [Elysia marginata]|uniref:Sugar phosphate exchanger 3 n=1 Tax=Elysia marginata TaxID=1093978 RepID=A0AAV4ETH1_9GAST|nr:sugar phosphate exchanger 2 [Elysia marginata]
MTDAPFLITVLPNVFGYRRRDFTYRWFILVFTFFCYASYHLSRKPISVVKSVLHQNCSKVHADPSINTTEHPNWCDWAPFDDSDYKAMFGTLDVCYLVAYALAMFLSGHIADRMNLRLYLSAGMVLSGLFTVGFGLGYFYNIHSYYYYIAMQIIGGVFQASGWPGVVACVGNWFGKGKRGLIMGVWNAHTSVGNMLGSVIAGAFVETNWGLSFVVPGVIIGGMGILVFLFLVPHPKDVDCMLPDHSDATKVNIVSRNIDTEADTEEELMVKRGESTGVLEFALCLFFAKLVSYTFLYWLPNYIKSEAKVSAEKAAYTSTIFDAGGIVGGILAGYISDKYHMRGVTCVLFLVLAAPMMFVYNQFGSSVPFGANCVLLAVCGLAVNGPYALITTAVSADLGTHKTVRDNAKALGMVTAIIDGTGSIAFGANRCEGSPREAGGYRRRRYHHCAEDER